MPTFYISPQGNPTGSGTITFPWLTLAQGVSSASAGDTVYVISGSYCENNDGPGRFLINKTNYSPSLSFVSLSGSVKVSASTNTTDNIVFGKSGVSFTGFEFVNSNFSQSNVIRNTGIVFGYSFNYCTFSLDPMGRTIPSGSYYCFNNTNGYNFTCSNCLFRVVGVNPSEFETLYYTITSSVTGITTLLDTCKFQGDLQFSTATNCRAVIAKTAKLTINSCSFNDFSFYTISSNNADITMNACITSVSGGGYINDPTSISPSKLTINNCMFDARSSSSVNTTPMLVSSSSIDFNNSSFFGKYYGASIGGDAYVNYYYVSGTINNCQFASSDLNGHSCLIGSGVNRLIMNSSSVWENPTGYGLVLKECTNTFITNSLIYGGLSSSVYFKSANFTTMSYCTIIDNGEVPRVGGVSAIQSITNPPTNHTPYNNRFTNNTIILNGYASYYYIVNDASGSVYDFNTVYVNNGNSLGTIFGTTVNNKNDIVSAWTTNYNGVLNDNNSTFIYPATNTVITYALRGAPAVASTDSTIQTRTHLTEYEMMFDPYVQSILDHIDYLRRSKRLTPIEESILYGEISGRIGYLRANNR
jgi:hypothetical protein